MNCRDLREVADSFLGEELLTETNHEILRHLENCPTCRTEIDARRRLRSAVRVAFNRAPELRPAGEFADRLRAQLREASADGREPWKVSGQWLAIAVGLVLAAAVTAGALLNRLPTADAALAWDAVGDHRNCALKYRLVRRPLPLEEAAQRFDSAYRLLLSVPPDDIAAPGGPARVLERHSCAYRTHRFGHVILQYRGRVVSLLVAANERSTGLAASDEAIPHLIGRPMDGLSMVSVNGSRHAIMLVSDLDNSELTQLAGIVSLPLVQRLGDVSPNGTGPASRFFAQPVQKPASYTDPEPNVSSLPTR
jgi:hypothetical protein